MLKKISQICLIVASSFALLSSPVMAQDEAVATDQSTAPVKVGYFNFLKLVNSVPQAKMAEERLAREFEPRQTQISKMDKDLKAESAELEKNALLLSDSDRVAKERELRAKDRELKLLYQEYQEELELRRNEETRAIQKLVYQAVVDIAKAEAYDLILEQGTVYASPRVDITARVLQKITDANQ